MAYYYIRILKNSGDHDTEKVMDMLKKHWPSVEWDVSACPSPDEEGRSVYQAFSGEHTLGDLVNLADTGFPLAYAGIHAELY